MNRNLSTVLLSMLLLGCVMLPAAADDNDIFIINTVAPNVVILIDSSGSMDNTIDGSRKIDIAKAVTNRLIFNVDGVNFGVFRFSGASNGGQIVSEIGTDKMVMMNQVNSITPNGSTPLGRATQDVQDYFKGLYTGSTCTGDCDGDDDDSSDDEDEDWTLPQVYPSPIQYECQKNYAIIITDGMPNGEAQDLVTDVAGSMFTSDHSPLDGVQNVIAHTIGFDVPTGAALLQATADAGGGNFYTASNAAELEQAMLDALTVALEDTFSFAQPLFPSTGVTGGDLAYLASFEPDLTQPYWKGHLKAYTRSSDGTVPLSVDGVPLDSAMAWNAGTLLAARAASSRTIFTMIGGSRELFTTGNAALSAAALGISTGDFTADLNTRTRVIDFVRGLDALDDDGDSNTAEEREWKLGDIYHSKPVLVFPPPLNSPDPDYGDFKNANASRTTVVLVGANDGMLHAFRASDGAELWGFIPPDLLGELQEMVKTVGPHWYFVDASPIVADVKTGGAWKTVTVFGERRGGRFYHALNVTDTSDPLYLWGFTDAEMGETWSEPAIGNVRLSDGTVKYVAFVGGGYDTDDNNASGRAFYVIDLENGTKLWEYKTGGINDAQYMNFSVPARPALIDTNLDGFVDRVYVGDVGGQLWKFDVSAPATLSGGMVNNWTGKRLFTAVPGQTNPPAAGEFFPAQAMYNTPVMVYDSLGALWVLLGSGDRNNPKDTSSNYFYAIKDDTTMANGTPLTPASLADASAGDTVTQGWYYPLSNGEKVLAEADAFNGVVYFTTYTPDVADPCVAANGEADLYGIRLEDGLPGVNWITNEILDSPTGSEAVSTDIGGGIPGAPDIVIGETTDTVTAGATDGTLDETPLPSSRTKRLRYWREVF